jgi:hypothetical protein
VNGKIKVDYKLWEGSFLKRRLIIITAVVIVLVIGVSILLNQKYMFSPISFQQDKITRNDWSSYKYPAHIEYLRYEDDKGWTIKSIVKDKNEIDFIFKQMKKNQGVISTQSDFFDRRKDMGKEKIVIIRHLEPVKNGTGPILFQFHYYDNSEAADLGNGIDFVPISDDLKMLLQERTQ